ncbi:15707_t:CDS:1, partial [Acaulospora colombiana]
GHSVDTIDTLGINLGDITDFAYLCQGLVSFSICFDARLNVNREGDVIKPSIPWKRAMEGVTSKLSQLYVGGSPVFPDQVVPVSSFLTAVFPNLEAIYCADMRVYLEGDTIEHKAWEDISNLVIGPITTRRVFHGEQSYHNYAQWN